MKHLIFMSSFHVACDGLATVEMTIHITNDESGYYCYWSTNWLDENQ